MPLICYSTSPPRPLLILSQLPLIFFSYFLSVIPHVSHSSCSSQPVTFFLSITLHFHFLAFFPSFLLPYFFPLFFSIFTSSSFKFSFPFFSCLSTQRRHDLDLICRAHQVVEDGYEFYARRQLVTIFSAPNYCGEFDNSGAMMSVDDTLMCSFQVHSSTYCGMCQSKFLRNIFYRKTSILSKS